MQNPLLIVLRVGATVMTAVFALNWLDAPGALTLEHARQWEVDSYAFSERAGRVSLLQSSGGGRRVKLSCEHYAALCSHVGAAGATQLRVWTDELGYFVSTSLIQARAGGVDIVSFESQRAAYEARTMWRNAPLLFFLTLAVAAWWWPKLAKHRSSRHAA